MKFQHIKPSAKLATTIGAVFLLSGCADFVASAMAPPTAAKAININESQFTHDVKFDPTSDRLMARERTAIDRFMKGIGLQHNDGVELRIAPTSPSTLGDRRRSIVRAYLRLRRVTVKAATPDETLNPAAAPLRIVVNRVTVSLPKCPDWTKDVNRNYANSVHSNFGCANAINLGQMIANPTDLIRPNGPGLIDGEYAAGAISRYHKGKTKPLLEGSTSGASPTSSGGGGS